MMYTDIAAQTYDFTYKTRKKELAVSLAVWGASHVYSSLRDDKTFAELGMLNRNDLWSIDRKALDQNSTSADSWSDATLLSSLVFPIVLNLKKSQMDDKTMDVLLMGFHGLFLENGINHIVKIAAQRPRPFVYSAIDDSDLGSKFTKSFYSGHASTSSFLCYFGAKVFSDRYPESKLKPLVWSLAIALPATTSYLRYKAGKHFPTDVFTGYVIGGAIGYIIPTLYKNPNLTIGGTASGFNLKLRL